MGAYVSVDTEVIDPAGYEGCKKLVSAVVKFFFGKYLAHGGLNETFEGNGILDIRLSWNSRPLKRLKPG